MPEERQDLPQLLEHRERDYLLGKAKVSMKTSVENLDAGDFRIDQLRGGETTELPRWAAEELVGLGLADMSEEPFETEMFRALSKEKLMGPLQLSALPQDFYLRLRRKLSQLSAAVVEGKAKKEEFDKVRSAGYDLIGMRLSKLLSLSSSSTTSGTLSEKLTPEELTFFGISQELSREWRVALLGVQR